MLVRVCLLVCASILLARANPVPQDQTQLPDNDQLQESNNTTEQPETENEAVESDSDTEEPPNSNSDSEEINDQIEAEGSGNDSELNSDSGADKSSSDGNEDEEDESTFEDNESDSGSEHDESDYNSESHGSDDEDSDAKDDNPENENNLSIVQSNGVILRVYTFSTDDEEVTCQEIKKKDKVIENKCFATQSLFPHFQGEYVSVFNKFIDGENFICQEIISYFKGPIQVLCASNERFFYRESTVLHNLHPGSSYFGHIDINLPLY